MATTRILSAIIILLLVQGCSREVPQPNIIHITADDLGYGELGSFGQTLINTPHLDEMAAQGMRFTQHYAGSPLCKPSRYAFQTGRHAGTTGMTTNASAILPENSVTIAKLMRGAGYYTGIIGKWALNEPSGSGAPLNQGFDYFFGYPYQRAAHNYFPESLMENDEHIPLTGNTASEQENISAVREVYAGDIIHQRALAFMENNRERFFYLQLDYNLPHVNNELHELTGNGFEHPGPGRYADRDWTAAEKSYAEMVSLMDDYVGELLATLESLGIADKTLVIFTSDNGPTGVRGREVLKRFNATGGFRGMKGMLFEAGIRVPMIAWWPGTVEAGAVSDDVTVAWDVLPTLAELARLQEQASGEGQSFAPVPPGDGLSFVPVLLGEGQMPTERMLYWEIRDRQAVRYGDWKWVHHPMVEGSDFLYNIAENPGEYTNLAEKHPEIMARLQGMGGQARGDQPHQ